VPWHIEADNPDCQGFAVVKDGTSEVGGCHRTRSQAERQLAALYASEPEARAPGVPTNEMAAEAERGLKWREEFGRGGTLVGVARARDIANKRTLSASTIRRMRSYFARHEVDKQGEGWSPGEDGYPSPGRVAWAAWGGDAGRSWANGILEGMDRSIDAPGEVIDAVILSEVDPEETDTVTSETADRAVADTPVGATRRDLQRLALPILLGDTNNAS